MLADLATTALFASTSAYIYTNRNTLTFPDSKDAFLALDPQTQLLFGAEALLGAFVAGSLVMRLVYETNPLATTWQLFSTFWTQEKRRKINVNDQINEYNDLHKVDVKERESKYQKLVDAYYELATQFYEWGWGQSFHFASRMKDETFFQSIKRHEYYLASRLNVKRGGKLLDCGCGIGGPMRNICRFTQCHVTGITINQYQVLRGNQLNTQLGLYKKQCESVQGDFMKLPFANESFDGVYAIEATCHAPSRNDCFTEIMRVLKPGATFVCYEWCLTDKYDPKNAEHRHIKKLIEEGDGLPDMATCKEVEKSLRDVGFEVVEARDMVYDDNIHIPWYTPLTPSWNPLSQRFQFNPVGLVLTRVMLRIMEALWLAPAGTCKVQAMLQHAAVGLAIGGQKEIFTPMLLLVARKPLRK